MTTFTTEDRIEAFKAIEGDDEIQAAQTQEQEDKEPRSFWNHRVVRMPDDGLGEDWLEIQEVYYNNKGEPCGYCNATAGSETLEGVALQVERFAECLKLPILNATTDFDNKWDEDYAKEY
jgi:hypothetical protein